MWVGGWVVESVTSEHRAGGSHYTPVTAVVLRDKSTRGESFFFILFYTFKINHFLQVVYSIHHRIMQSGGWGAAAVSLSL